MIIKKFHSRTLSILELLLLNSSCTSDQVAVPQLVTVVEAGMS